MSFPVGIGKDDSTPTGVWAVASKLPPGVHVDPSSPAAKVTSPTSIRLRALLTSSGLAGAPSAINSRGLVWG